VRAPLKVRLLAIPLVILPLLAGLVLYIATRDWEHLRRQYELGHKPTLPPRTKEGPKPEAIDAAQHTLASVFEIACLIAVCALLLMLAIVARGVCCSAAAAPR
jgi:ABC-type Fe3+ transport system permease subunit